MKESFLTWLGGQILPTSPAIADDDRLGLQWRDEIVLPRRHRTTGKLIGTAWAEERPLLRPVPAHLLQHAAAPVPSPAVIDLRERRLGEHVEIRNLTEYEVAR